MADKKEEIQKKEAESVETVERTRSGKVFYPLVDIMETEKEIVLFADMPGVDKKGLDMTLEKDVLSIDANVQPVVFDDFELDYAEYEMGDFHRSFTLNDTIDQKKIQASYKNGVLQLTLPKAEPAKPKRIKIVEE